MERPLSDTDLVISTPERVSFEFQVAGVGTRALAQLLDLLILGGVLVALIFFVLALVTVTGSNTLAVLALIAGGFIFVFGYFWVSEALWSGQTVGKKVFRLRAVGDRGEPLTFTQAGIRNVVRIVDFLPYGYGIGMVVLFANGKGKRLGDLAAGTIVVKDSDHVWLWQLPGGRPVNLAAVQPPNAPPAGVTYQYPAAPPPPAPPGAPAGPAPITFAPASAAELKLRRLDPELRRFVTSYARRRADLSLDMRVQLAGTLQSSLQAAEPDVFAGQGPLATLDHLADLERQ